MQADTFHTLHTRKGLALPKPIAVKWQVSCAYSDCLAQAASCGRALIYRRSSSISISFSSIHPPFTQLSLGVTFIVS